MNFPFLKKETDLTEKPVKRSNNVDISPITSMVFGNKRYSLYRFKTKEKDVYFITGNDILLYSFVITAFDSQSKFLFKNDNGDDLSIIILFDIDSVKYAVAETTFTIDNYKELGTIIDKFGIGKTLIDDSLARIILSASVEGIKKINSISLLNYKEVQFEDYENGPADNFKKSSIKKEQIITEQQVEPEKTVFDKKETEEVKKSSKSENTVATEFFTSNTKILSEPMSDITQKVKEIKSQHKTKIDPHYFVGYKIKVDGNSVDNTYSWEYDINQNKAPVKIYFSPKDFNKILTTHMFISGKTGSGKTSFNNNLIHSLLYHGVNIFAFDIKSGSIDYSSTLIKKPESSDRILNEIMNSERYKGTLKPEKNIMFTKEDIPQEALKLLNPSIGGFKNRFGNDIVPIVIYNNPDELENIRSFTTLNILDNQLRLELVKLTQEQKNGKENSAEYNAGKQEYKEGLNLMLTVYFRVLSQKSSISSDKFISVIADFVTNKIITFMEKTGFSVFPTNFDFANWIHDYSMFGKDLKPDSEELRFINNVYDNNLAKKIIDFENGINLYTILTNIVSNMKTNFYITIRTNPDLVGFYIIYIYYLLVRGEKLKIPGMVENECYTAVFIDEAHYLNDDAVLNKVLTDAQRTDRLRNRGWIFSSQRIFMKSFGKQESLGNYVLFGQQSGDVSSQKTRFSKIFNKYILQFINTLMLTFTYDNDNFFVDEDGNYLSRDTTAIKSFPNRAQLPDIMEYGKDKYSAEIQPYLAQNFVSNTELKIQLAPLKIGFDLLNNEGKLVLASFTEQDEIKIRNYLTDVLEPSLSEQLSLPDNELNTKAFSTNTLQFIEKIMMLIEVNRQFSTDARLFITEYIDSYNSENNRKMILEILRISDEYKNRT